MICNNFAKVRYKTRAKNHTLDLCQHRQKLGMRQEGILFKKFHFIAVSNNDGAGILKVFVSFESGR